MTETRGESRPQNIKQPLNSPPTDQTSYKCRPLSKKRRCSELPKGDYERVVPLHSHLLDQGLLDYVESRRGARLPLFYDPKRARGGDNANPQWQKIAQRLGEWVTDSLRVTGVKPNHGWRHRFKSTARHVHMHPEVEKFITGHGGSDDPDEIAKVSQNYGDAWVKTLQQTIEMYPRYRIAELALPAAPRKRTRRSPAQMAADKTSRVPGRSRKRSDEMETIR